MFGLEFGGNVDVARGGGGRLAGQAVHQIDIHTRKRFDRGARGAPRRRRVVRAPQNAQGVVVECLRAQRDAVDSRFGETGEAFGVGRAGVGFDCDFGFRRERQQRANPRQQKIDRGGRE